MFLLISLAMFVSLAANAQKNAKVEVLYFKANLSCCQAKSCALLENDVKDAVEKTFTDGKVTFKEIKLADEANKELIEKYKAGSQTVVVVKKTKKGEKSIDISEQVKQYRVSQNKEELSKVLADKVTEIRAQK